MENNDNKLVELVAKDGYLLMDKERTATFKRIWCRQDNLDEFIEVTEAEALQAIEEYEKLLKIQDEVRDRELIQEAEEVEEEC